MSTSLTALPEGAPQAGDRFPWLRLKLQANGPVEDMFEKLDDTQFHLIVIGQKAPVEEVPGLDELLRIHVIPKGPVNDLELARAGLPQPSYFLVRPDGHIGLCGIGPDAIAIEHYFSEKIHLTKRTTARAKRVA